MGVYGLVWTQLGNQYRHTITYLGQYLYIIITMSTYSGSLFLRTLTFYFNPSPTLWCRKKGMCGKRVMVAHLGCMLCLKRVMTVHL